MLKTIWAEVIVLFSGTVFAWYNFTKELIDWNNSKSCTTGCYADFMMTGVVNPFYTPCFFGAIFFTIAFIISIVLLLQAKKREL